MNTITINFKATGQKLRRTGNATPFASDTIAYIYAKFELDEDWSAFDFVRAIWKGTTAYVTVLNENGECAVPTELLTKKGTVKVNLIGSNVNGDELVDRLTTFQETALTVSAKVPLDGNDLNFPTPSEYEQFVILIGEYAEEAKNARNGALTSENRAIEYADSARTYSESAKASVEEIGNIVDVSVDKWLNEHPEATTTVQDNSITVDKFDSSVVDDTLTGEGHPADAYVVGKKLSDLTLVDSLDLARFPFLTFKDISDGRVSTQGMCVADGYLIITKFKNDSDTTRFYVIDIENRKYVSHYEYVTGHSNCLAYGNGNIYIADSSNVYVIPFSDGVMGEMVTKQTSFSATAVAYNPSNNKLYFRAYLSPGSHAIYESDTSLSEAGVICNIVAPISDLTPQGFGCDGEYMYEVTSGADRVERIFVYSMKGELVKCFEIPRDTFMEVQDIDFYDGYMFLNFNGSDSIYPPYVMCVPYLMDTEPSNISTVWRAINTYYHETELLDLYLDNTTEIAFPDGTSDNPFNTLFHATMFIKNMRVPVRLNVSGTYATFKIRHITASPLMLAFDDAQITNLEVVRCSDVILTGSATLKTLKVEQGNCYCASISIMFVGDSSTNAISINRGMMTGFVGSMTTYAAAVRGLQGIINISISNMTNVSSINNSVSSMVCVNGTIRTQAQ